MLKNLFTPKRISAIVAGVSFFIGIIYSIVSFTMRCIIYHSTKDTLSLECVQKVFFYLAILSFFVWAFGFIYIQKCNSNDERLLLVGQEVLAKIVKIETLKYVNVGYKRNPYVIRFTYEFKNNKYQSCSYLLWKKYNFHLNDQIEIYIDKSKPFYTVIDYDKFSIS